VLANSNWCVWMTQQHVGKLLAKNRPCLYSLFANSLPTCCCAVHTHQFEFANKSWPTLVWRVKADLVEYKPSRSLCSSTQNLFAVPPKKSKNGDRAFQVAAPKLWNSMPSSIRLASSLTSFKTLVKTFLFQKCFSSYLTLNSCNIQIVLLVSLFFVFIFYSMQEHRDFVLYFRWWVPWSLGRVVHARETCAIFVFNLGLKPNARERLRLSRSIFSCECSMNFILERNSFRNETHSGIMWIAPNSCFCGSSSHVTNNPSHAIRI